MSKSKQATGGSANKGPGNGHGVKPRSDRQDIPGKSYNVVPNSSKRGKQG